MPAERQEAIAAIASSRGGSMISNRPSSVNPAATSAKISPRWSSARRLGRDREHALPPLCELLDSSMPGRGIKRPVAALGAGEGAHAEHLLRGALEVDVAAPVVVVAQGGHEPVFGLERDRVRAWALLALEVEVQPGFDADRQQRALGRVASTTQWPASVRRSVASLHSTDALIVSTSRGRRRGSTSRSPRRNRP